MLHDINVALSCRPVPHREISFAIQRMWRSFPNCITALPTAILTEVSRTLLRVMRTATRLTSVDLLRN